MEETEGQLVFYLLCGYAALRQLPSQLGLLPFNSVFQNLHYGFLCWGKQLCALCVCQLMKSQRDTHTHHTHTTVSAN